MKKNYIRPEVLIEDINGELVMVEASRTQIDSGNGNGSGTGTTQGGPGITEDNQELGAKGQNYWVFEDDYVL